MSAAPDDTRQTEHDKLRAEIAKLIAETTKINAEARWYPYVVVAGIFGAALAIMKLLSH